METKEKTKNSHDILKLLKRIKELEVINDILWEYIWERDYEEINNRLENIKIK